MNILNGFWSDIHILKAMILWYFFRQKSSGFVVSLYKGVVAIQNFKFQLQVLIASII